MALRKEITLPTGFQAPMAYWRIENFSGSLSGVNIRLIAYKSMADYQQGLAAIAHEDVPMPFDGGAADNIIRQGYIFIKGRPGWENSVDA